MRPKEALCIKRRFAYFGREVAGEGEEDVNEKDDGLETNAQPAPCLHLRQRLSVRIEGENVLEENLEGRGMSRSEGGGGRGADRMHQDLVHFQQQSVSQ